MQFRRGLIFLVTVLVLLPLAPAQAISPAPGPGNTNDRHIHFVFDGSGWDVVVTSYPARTRRQAATTGFLRWEEPRDFDGRTYVDLWSDPPGTARVVRVIPEDFPPGFCGAPDADGCYKTSPDRIYINTDIWDDGARLENVAAHEMGHALGLSHSGDNDVQTQHNPAFDQHPLMASCVDSAYANLMDEDDASIAYQRSALVPEPVMPNASVETARLYPWRSSGNPVSVVGSGSADGVHHLMVVPNSQYDNVNNAVNYDTAAGRLISARTNYVTPGGVSGTIRVVVEARPVYYEPAALCSYPTGRNENARTQGNWFVVSQGSFAPSSTWTWKDPPTWQVPAHGNFDVRVRVYSTVSAGGGYIHVHYDNVRVRELA